MNYLTQAPLFKKSDSQASLTSQGSSEGTASECSLIKNAKALISKSHLLHLTPSEASGFLLPQGSLGYGPWWGGNFDLPPGRNRF
jgi:hypothetical protein